MVFNYAINVSHYQVANLSLHLFNHDYAKLLSCLCRVHVLETDACIV